MTCTIPPPLTEPQLGAVAKLACGIESSPGIVVLCGPPGVGKTTILQHLAAGQVAEATSPCPVHDLSYWLATDEELPHVVIADDAHMASEKDLFGLLARCRDRRPTSTLVLAGQGRLLTLMARDRRLAQATILTAPILPGNRDDTASLVERDGRLPSVDDATLSALHEIAGGVPADITRLLDLACLVAESEDPHRVSPDTIEAIHRRLSPRAA